MKNNTASLNNLHTVQEINSQPRLWKETFQLLSNSKEAISKYLQPILAKENLRIIVTGAGSSAFIGEASQSIIQKQTNRLTQPIATTDLVTHPDSFFLRNTPTLLISFARSGNSPESLEAVSLADEFSNDIYHLIITCNKDGALVDYHKETKNPCYSIVLPEETNDKSLAMTSSFTSMLLTALLVTDIKNIDKKATDLDTICEQAEAILNSVDVFAEITERAFERVVFLGSGEKLGIARECHLKLQELTDGKVICKFDSFLGFRHGPRAVVNANTLLVYLFSEDEHVFKYEKDLVEDIAKDPRNIQAILAGGVVDIKIKNAVRIPFQAVSNNTLQLIPVTLIGQLLGLYKSLKLSLNPDNPSVSGAINRVVQGVNIYKK
ncbi:SIS domain-containing protein [Joostella sp. CR20]|uniref:SIS domain-containing protein n=1 Tax=Joostella sp. CR20 TaxID=2804312 RepID=UPI00313D82AF